MEWWFLGGLLLHSNLPTKNWGGALGPNAIVGSYSLQL